MTNSSPFVYSVFVVNKTRANRLDHSPPPIFFGDLQIEKIFIDKPQEWGRANKQRRIDGIYCRN